MPKKKLAHLKKNSDRKSAQAAAAKHDSADQPFVEQLCLLAKKAHDNKSAFRAYIRGSDISGSAPYDRYCWASAVSGRARHGSSVRSAWHI